MTKTDTTKTLVRPIVTYLFVAAILSIGAFLIVKRPGDEMTKDFAVFILSSGSLIIGMWFGSRNGASTTTTTTTTTPPVPPAPTLPPTATNAGTV